MKYKIFIGLFVFVFVIGIAGSSTTILLQDAETENVEDTHNFAGSVGEVGSSTLIRSGDGSDPYDDINHLFIKFFSTINFGDTIDSSILSLYFNDADGSGAFDTDNIMSIFELDNQSWMENCHTFTTPPCPFAYIGSELETFNVTTQIPDGTPKWVNFTVTPWAQEVFITNNQDNISFVINSTIEGVGGLYKFRSKEHATTATRPILYITYEEPTAPRLALTDQHFKLNDGHFKING